MPKPVQNPRVGQQLQREYNLVGRVRPQLDEVIMPVCVVSDVRQPSVAVLRRAAAFANQTGVAGERAVFRFEIPGGIIAVINRIIWLSDSTANGHVFFGSSITAPGSTADKAYIDGRLRYAGETPAGVLTYDTQAAALATIHERIAIGAGSISAMTGLDVDWPVGTGVPGQYDFVEFQDSAVNTASQLTLEWTEVQAF